MADSVDLSQLLENKELIDIIEGKDHIALAKYIGRQLHGFTPDDEKYIDIFWDVAFNKGWIYLSDEMVMDWMGYKRAKNTMTNFVMEMKKKYTEDKDYKEVDSEHELVNTFYWISKNKKDTRGGKKHYIVTGEALKKMLIRAGTKQGDITCDYFIKIEALASTTTNIAFKYMEHIKNVQLEQTMQQIAKLEGRQLKLESFVKNIKSLEKNQIFYIATTRNYASQNRFKYGGVKDAKDINARLKSYDVGRPEGDSYYYTKIFKCNNYKVIEDRVGDVLQQFKDKQDSRKEMLHLRYDRLIEIIDFICDNADREIDYINRRCQEFLNVTIDEEPIIPEPLDLSNTITITHHNNGVRKYTKKIDVSDWTQEQIDNLITNMINEYMRVNPNQNKILWKEFKLAFSAYKQTLTYWKAKILELFKKEQDKAKAITWK